MPAKYTATLRSDGRYQVKQDGHTFYGKTAKQACQKRDAFFAAAKNTSGEESVRSYALRWLPVAKAHVETKTYNDYANQLDKLNSIIGDMPIKDVTPSDIKRIYSERFLDVSESTIRRARQLYNSMFRNAVEDGLIGASPCTAKAAQPHKGPAGTHRVIEDWEKELILTTEHPFRAAAAIMLYAGLRRGEVAALTAEDIDLRAGTISVTKAIRYESNQPILDTPKTAAGTRIVPIFAPLKPYLKSVDKLVAPSSKGVYMSARAYDSMWNGFIHTIEERMNGCQKRWFKKRHPGETWKKFTVRPHDFRHTFCTMLRDAGVDMKLAMKWLGHADEKMILRIYDHVTDNRTKQAVRSVNSFLK